MDDILPVGAAVVVVVGVVDGEVAKRPSVCFITAVRSSNRAIIKAKRIMNNVTTINDFTVIKLR